MLGGHEALRRQLRRWEGNLQPLPLSPLPTCSRARYRQRHGSRTDTEQQPVWATWLSICVCVCVHVCACVCKKGRRRDLCMCLFAGEPVPRPHLLLQRQKTGHSVSNLHLWGLETTATSAGGGWWGCRCRVHRCVPACTHGASIVGGGGWLPGPVPPAGQVG